MCVCKEKEKFLGIGSHDLQTGKSENLQDEPAVWRPLKGKGHSHDGVKSKGQLLAEFFLAQERLILFY